MPLEVELKFPLADEAALRARLATFAITWHEPEVQVDCYFNHPARDFSQTDEALRLRKMGEQNVITYKGPKLDALTKTRREIELPIAAGDEGLAQFGELLTALSFRRVAEVKKTRTKANLTWQGCPVEVALDQVDGVGPFIELEIQASESDLALAKQAILDLAATLNLTNPERRSYLQLLLNGIQQTA
ncbi:CYTH domain protein [Anatilimnocola aggregata]|uniref:CYTH domain protein n=1 Tax=Anatilimnocola aggregata TaxID=2528021 RepID=A0A517YHQ2_9BACT|nr:class IV adenylate cyclase [Anatilimnocola aggregata]QDU29735.1 CYTH domain protein [Anatilimnocola aggregata]